MSKLSEEVKTTLAELSDDVEVTDTAAGYTMVKLATSLKKGQERRNLAGDVLDVLEEAGYGVTADDGIGQNPDLRTHLSMPNKRVQIMSAE